MIEIEPTAIQQKIEQTVTNGLGYEPTPNYRGQDRLTSQLHLGELERRNGSLDQTSYGLLEMAKKHAGWVKIFGGYELPIGDTKTRKKGFQTAQEFINRAPGAYERMQERMLPILDHAIKAREEEGQRLARIEVKKTFEERFPGLRRTRVRSHRESEAPVK